MNFPHFLQGLVRLRLRFNHSLQFQGRHFWQAEWWKRVLYYIISRINLFREEQMQHFTGVDPDLSCTNGQLVSERASDWQCLTFLAYFFPLWQQCKPEWLLIQSVRWEAEQRRGELKQGTGAGRSHGDREVSVRNSEQIVKPQRS